MMAAGVAADIEDAAAAARLNWRYIE